MREPASEIFQQFDRIRRDQADRPLIHLPAGRTTLTAADVFDAAIVLRERLARAGCGPHHLVIYAGGNRPETFGVWLACRALDAVLMPVDAGTALPEIASLAVRFGAHHVILADGVAAAELGDADPFVPGLVRVSPRRPVPAPHRYRGAAALKLTSGSAGLPKATFTTEAQLIEDTNHIMAAMDIRPDDCQMAAIPLSHAYGIGSLLVPLLLRGTAIVLRDGFVPHQFAADAAAFGARVFPGVPFMFEHLRDHLSPGAWPAGLERLISAGARLDGAAARAFHASFGVKIHSFYGTTETGGIAFDDGPGLDEQDHVGRPMPGVSITLRPEAGIAGGGRIHVAGSAVASRYAGDDGDTGEFIAGGFLTGDYGRFDGRGRLVLTGRVSSFINVAGRKVQPEEVEAVLREMPEIADVRVVGAPDPARGQQVVACIVPRRADPGVLAVRRFCAARLAAFKIPRTIVVLDRIPLTERGKTDRQRLHDAVAARLREAPEAGVL